jgi:O-antigen/teichoic acid export membrane protein
MLNKIKNQLINVKTHPLFKGSFILLLANTFGSFINYLYHLISGRYLSLEDFGLLQSLISLSYFLGVILEAFSFSIIKAINKIKSNQILTFSRYLLKKIIPTSLLFWLIVLLTYPVLNSLIHINNYYYFSLFTFQIVTSFLSAIYLAILRSKLKFSQFSFVTLTSIILKTLSLTFFFIIGLRITSSLYSLILSGIFSLTFSSYLVKKIWPNSTKPLKNLDLKLKTNSTKSLITNICLTSLISTDIILVRFFLSPQMSGVYAATSVVGKIIFFISGPISLVAFSIFNLKKSKYNSKITFITSLSLISITSLLISIFPQFILQALYANNYNQAGTYLSLFSIFIFLYTIFNFIIQYLLSQEKKSAQLIPAIVAITQIILILIYHSNLKIIIINSIISIGFGLILSSFFAIKILYSIPSKKNVN